MTLSELVTGEMQVIGRLVDASNATLLCEVSTSNEKIKVIYKPIAGERPLWDFPDGHLALREFAAYIVSSMLEFDVVPETVLRDGPFGEGSVQRWIDVEEDVDVVTLASERSRAIEKLVLFDAVANNTDRKYGHILPVNGGHIYGCDHGVTFHSQNKLRTVLWQFAGDRIPDDFIEKLKNFLELLPEAKLAELLTEEEIASLADRVKNLIEVGEYPYPSEEWPAVPWPPF